MTHGINYSGPVVLAILDGVGIAPPGPGNAVSEARTDFLARASRDYLNIPLAASGSAVGILPGTMGNSEVGHSTIGCGQIIHRGAAKVSATFETGEIWQTSAWQGLVRQVLAHNSTLHLSGILSDGGVHSHISHLEQILATASQSGIKTVRLHLIFDGRDVSPRSAPSYLKRLQDFLHQLNQPDYLIASGGGRMVFVADRYNSDWKIVQAGWDAIVLGQASHTFASAESALDKFYQDQNLNDQYLPPFVITKDQGPIGLVKDHDAFLFFNFRADRAIEFTSAFVDPEFDAFDRKFVPQVFFVGMTEYDSDRHLPAHTLVPSPVFSDTLNFFLGQRQISQYAISETVKFGHITYYFNGNSYQKAPLEFHQEILSDTVPFNTRPWMKSAETTDALLENLPNFRFLRINYPGGDMVGHLGDLQSTIQSIEAIDLQLHRIAKEVDRLGGILIITADHGNAEALLDQNHHPLTAHTTNLVPCIFYDNTKNAKLYHPAKISQPGLSHLASTIAFLLGQSNPPSSWQPSLLESASSHIPPSMLK